MNKLKRFIKGVYAVLFFVYQNIIVKMFIVLGVKGECRFYPTCGEYSKQAFQKYSFFKALYKTIKRLIKCYPGRQYTYDPLV